MMAICDSVLYFILFFNKCKYFSKATNVKNKNKNKKRGGV